MNENPCTTCQAPEDFKKWVCYGNQLHNAFEPLKAAVLSEFYKAFRLDRIGYEYTPDIQCWHKELLEEWEANNADNLR